MPRFVGPEPLARQHPINGFESGEGSLDVWLARHSRSAGGVGSAKTYVVTDVEQESRVVGYYALSGASLDRRDATERAAKGLGRHPVPAVLLARLAVDRTVQRRGIGAMLLQDAMARAHAVSEEIGIRLLLTHALGDSARAFYMKFGFERSPTDPMNLQILIKDIRPSIDARE
ncbi:MAG TPA: GNAT family N-acetyltransferase [Solirubrobacterales bacterium]|nr:GNAT family N-acetyltransferase [Solirubrobacterales bacterium]